ncbi:MAG: tRNA lysidine(34) synthetase TilS [Hydrogenophaga sp.]|nr:tRNA lysidine(34) synthetase TilS [Hydrogenophaga sp.]
MAVSPTPKPTASLTGAEAAQPSSNPGGPGLARWGKKWPGAIGGVVAVAYSAGADSTALLLAANERWPGQVRALHVHHGLQAAADQFEALARQTCTKLDIPLQVIRVDARPGPGQSPEEAARNHRYRALADMASSMDAGVVLLAQHADDQMETVLLALSRGAGLPGLAAMPERFVRHGMVFGRPLLDVSAASLRTWLGEEGHAFIDDPSNADLRYTRNRIRSRLVPAWEESFPGFRDRLVRSARHAAQAQSLLDELAHSDLKDVGEPPTIRGLQAMNPARQANVLRFWLRKAWGVSPSEAQMDALLSQIQACRTRGHRIELKVADGQVLRVGDCLAYVRPDEARQI